MFKPRAVRDNVFWFGAVRWEKGVSHTLSQLHDGSSSNCYFLRGSDSNALIDTAPAACGDPLLEQLREVDSIGYVVVQNASFECCGMLPDIMALYESSLVVCTEQCASILNANFGIDPTRIRTVKSGDTLSLGTKTFTFIELPPTPWPGSMCSFVQEDHLFFSGSLFSAHFATSDLYAYDRVRIYPGAKRFFAENFMPFMALLKPYIQLIESFEPSLIAPAHGPLHYDAPFIINAYKNWLNDNPKNFVALPYVSMHGSTKRMIDYLVRELSSFSIPVQPINMALNGQDALACALLDAATIVFGSPTIHSGPHPLMVQTASIVNGLKPKAFNCAVVGSYGFESMMPKMLTGLLNSLNVQHLKPLLCRGIPGEKDYAALEKLAEEIAENHVDENLELGT
ncbi:MAG: hypothetical protein LBI42_05610 [Chitinispirillales bacterium]|jgi:flavorubredoxin|nr:hypothetical protein [Chitinispirillales bacterium]